MRSLPSAALMRMESSLLLVDCCRSVSLMASDLAAELDFALSLVDAADPITLPHFESRTFTVHTKANRTEVTEVDRAAETEVMDLVRTARPHHAWYGEEHGAGGDVHAEWTWVVDPIDGTSNYVRGVPVWATMVALVHRELGPVVGVVSAPAMQSRWWGVIDGGAYFNGTPISVSDVTDLVDAHLSVTANHAWTDAGKARNISHLTGSVRRVRGFGDFWQHMLVAEGAIDAAVDAIGLEPYDIAALVPIVKAAGGTITDRFGTEDWQANCAISTNGRLHDRVISILND